ncbi:DUF6745 domain-containing protein [Leptothoe sp. PORK10 BA2]|uniref:DUF6745 domain-containing protein n=1 Tax=Leptothoe sp. PORK10 BA2 TaxID=3110254 RepID=UPI002B1EC414|nr:hypothetical protein [Leptothoe sp. PORK10 BA2]MEA5464835.1 hypothetical protein [Leptothoe sp. PORK10 BA2]
MQTPIDQVSEKWIDVLSTPIDPAEATEVIGDLYQLIGHPLPKVVFLDSPWATSIAAELLLQQSSSTLTSVRSELINLSEKIYAQLLQQYLEEFDPNLFGWNDWNIRVNRMDAMDLAGQLSALAATQINFSHVSEDYYGYDATSDPWHGYPRTQLDDLTILATRFELFGYRHTNLHESNAWYDLISPSSRGANLNTDWISKLLYHLDYRLIHQLSILVNQSLLELEVYSFPLSKPIWFSKITDAAMFDFVASHGIQLEPKLLTVFLRAAQHLAFINPFKEICFVSDRPRFKRDTQNNLHAEGEPAVIFPDSFGMNYFYHGTALPQYIGSVHPSQWQPHWILQEQNAEVRRCLIQEIGYARICQELQAEEMDCWREYTLLKLPVYDDYSRIPELPPWERHDEVQGDSVYLLKMICPSTGSTYAIRVPPSMRSAREAATWINWGSDPEWFAVET